ncbi:MAG: flagellar export chaperone FliS [Magnetococcales bacterium]|nr:flagellar export chaperone FliS [Magnetococcales bacterium]PPR19481.1 MAG: Flagellar protein FliS [Pseudomonadota bacterium]
MNKNAAQHYKEQQILNATPAERVVLLYDGAIKFLLQAKRAIEEKNIQERFNSNKRASDIIFYLQDTLDMENGGEVAVNLFRIYGYMLRRLIEVDMKNDVEAVDDVIAKLRELNASWKKIASGDVAVQGQSSAENATHDSKENSEQVVSKSAIA